MFVHLGALLLASLAVSADSARSSDCNLKRSESILPRANSRADGWAGMQHSGWDPCRNQNTPIETIDVDFIFPNMRAVRDRGNNITFAVAIGDPGISWPTTQKFLWAGVHVGIKGGIFEMYPAWGNGSQYIKRMDNSTNHTFQTGDTIGLQVYSSPAGSWVLVSNSPVERTRDMWSSWYPLTDMEHNSTTIHRPSVGEAMIMASLVNPDSPTSVAYKILPDFGSMVFYDFAVKFRQVGDPPNINPPQQINYINMQRRSYQRVLAHVDTLVHADAFIVRYGRIGGGGGIF